MLSYHFLTHNLHISFFQLLFLLISFIFVVIACQQCTMVIFQVICWTFSPKEDLLTLTIQQVRLLIQHAFHSAFYEQLVQQHSYQRFVHHETFEHFLG